MVVCGVEVERRMGDGVRREARNLPRLDAF